MIIVTGIGRCGTSFVIKYLKECGLKTGGDKWFDAMNAGYENRQAMDINNRLIRHYVKGEDVNLYHVRGDIYELGFDAVKDVQFLTHPEIIKEWTHVRDDLKIVWMHRDPKEIAQSMKRVPEWNTPVYRCFPDMIEKKCQEFKEALEGLDWKRFMWPDVLENPGRLMKYVGKEDTKLWKSLIT